MSYEPVKQLLTTVLETSSAPDLRTGYKRTEVGNIPDDWEVVAIREVCRLINGRGFKPHEWSDRGLPIIRIQNLNGSEDFNFFDGKYDPKIEIQPGQLLFAWSGSRGTSFGPHIWKGPKAVLNYHTWKLVHNVERIGKAYLNYGLKQVTAEIEASAHGASALVHTQKTEMEGFLLPLPPMDEQNAIAAALGEAGALIKSIEDLISKKRDVKQGAMQELLTGQRRLAGFNQKWRRLQIADVAMVDQDNLGTITPATYSFNYISLEDVKVGSLNSWAEHYFSSAPSRARRRLRLDDILVSTVRPNLKSHLHFKKTGGPWVCSTGFSVVRCSHGLLDARYCYQLFFSRQVEEQIEALLAGSNYPAISSKDVKALQLDLPTYDEQRAIATILTDMDTEVAEWETRLAKARYVKQGMMSALLTGEVRLV